MRVVVGTSAIGEVTAAELGAAVVRGWHAAAADDLRVFELSDGATGLAASVASHPGPAPAVIETGPLLVGSSTAPVAEALFAAVDGGARRVVIGMARSTVHDGGRGFADVARHRHGSLRAAREALSGHDIVVVGNDRLPLVGLHGAGARLAATLGAERAQRLDREVADFAASVEAELPPYLGRPPRLATADRSGLGGGSAFLALALGARATSGIAWTVAASGLSEAIAPSDLCLVVVEEMNALALEDSAAAAVAPAALAAGCPVVVLTGEDHTSRRQRAALGIAGSYSTGGLDPGSLAGRVRGVARTWSR